MNNVEIVKLIMCVFILYLIMYWIEEWQIQIYPFINLRYLRLKLLKNKKVIRTCNIFHHYFRNVSCYVTSEASLTIVYLALFYDGLTLKTLKLTYIGLFIQTLHLNCQNERIIEPLFGVA